MFDLILLTIVCFISAFTLTPVIIKLAIKLNVVDEPCQRKIHKSPIPTLGGLAIFSGFLIGLLVVQPDSPYHFFILLGALFTIFLGLFDDIYPLSSKSKFVSQIVIASVVVIGGDLKVSFINLPFGGQIEFGWFSIAIAIFWIVGITNAINLIDGLDGLSAGISAIVLLTIGIMANFMGNVYVSSMSLILFWSIIGFLPYNFHPAKIFMGDTGSLFLGYMIAVLSLLGFKNVTLISFAIPILILAVPIFDTFVAIIRRIIQKRPISSPDRSHLHHRLLQLGLSQRQAVLFLYLLSGLFSVAAILFSMSTIWGAALIVTISLLVIQLLVEMLELIDSKFKPLTNLVKIWRGNRS